VTAERLLKLFDRVADAPDAVPRLKQLVLNLAVRGRLSTHQLSAAAELHQAGGNRPLPKSWRVANLAEIASIRMGKTPPRNEPAYWNTGEFAWAAISDLPDGGTLLTTRETISESGRQRSFKAPPEQPGTILLSFKLTIGKIARLGIPAYHNEAIAAIEPNARVDPEYLFLTLPMFARQGVAKNAIKGATLNSRSLANVRVVLPPLDDQGRIVAIVDELMALCDRLEVAQKEREAARLRFGLSALASIDRPTGFSATSVDTFEKLTADVHLVDGMRTVVQRLAVRGKLLLQDTRDEPASHLLASPSASRGRPTQSTRDEKSGAKEATVPPRGWSLVPLAAVLRDLQTGPFGSSLHQSDYRIGGTPVVNPASLRQGRIVPVPKMAVDEATLSRLQTFRLRTGDIVMARRGEMGRCAVVTQVEDGWLCGTGSLVLRLIPGVVPSYLALAIGAPSAREYLATSAVGITMQNLNQGVLKRMPLLLPPTAEQHRIVAKVNELMALCDQLEGQLKAGEIACSRLLDVLIAEMLVEPPALPA
jgi:type I restriction enzyme, S subunit